MTGQLLILMMFTISSWLPFKEKVSRAPKDSGSGGTSQTVNGQGQDKK